MKFTVSDIHWDTDEDPDYITVKDEQAMIDYEGEKFVLPELMVVECDEEDEAIDKCSDEYGFCIFNASVEELKLPSMRKKEVA